jgi:predicted acylesterase/phospholipase RssA
MREFELMADAREIPRYDCLVLSGGGARGAYGAGVAKALDVYRRWKGLNNQICYIGASAGALNAYILSSQGVDSLLQFWLSATRRSVLGTNSRFALLWAVLRWYLCGGRSGRSFSIYDNRGLRTLIGENARLDVITSPLIMAATDFTRGRLRAFYSSGLIDSFVDEDAAQPVRRQRLSHFRKIDSDETLVRALLASSAIPVFFPPVRITTSVSGKQETGLYVDGGVGNNTPVREAAYFFRFLERTGVGTPGVTYCIRQEPPRLISESSSHYGLVEILKRTLDIFHWNHTQVPITGWNRINSEVKDQRDKFVKMKTTLSEQHLDIEQENSIVHKMNTLFGTLGGQAPRVAVPLIEIEPSIPLGDIFDFDRARITESIVHGYNDTLRILRNRSNPDGGTGETLIDDEEFRVLSNLGVFSGEAP